jgi:alkylated DNA repair dioxygenase AlkB
MQLGSLFGDSPTDAIQLRDKSLSVDLWERFLDKKTADSYLLSLLKETTWSQPEIWMFGRKVKTPRLTSWFGDVGASYKYSGIRNLPQPWTPLLSELRKTIEDRLRCSFNSVLLNLYRDGNDYLSWHKDDETELGVDPIIASVSLGATRLFGLRTHMPEARRRSYDFELKHGSLMSMSGGCQSVWEHSLKKQPSILNPRVNLTFRQVFSQHG